MFKLTKLVTANPNSGVDGRARLEAALHAAAQPGGAVVRSMLQPTLPGVYNGGDYIWHLQFADEPAYRAWQADEAGGGLADATLADKALVAHVDSAAYEGGRSGSKSALERGAYRTLLLSVNRAPNEAAVERFDFETYEMGLYIPTIVNWQVSRVLEASGARKWTHVWEQEYVEIGGLHGAYMMHPHHWGHIDRWYDPECTDYMIDTHLCHTFCNFEGSMIAPKG
jgi:hypothetical protein